MVRQDLENQCKKDWGSQLAQCMAEISPLDAMLSYIMHCVRLNPPSLTESFILIKRLKLVQIAYRWSDGQLESQSHD